jgi:hypothetical protein
MITERQAARPRSIGRILIRVLLTIAGIIGGVLCYFFCERMFAGYPQYGTDILTYIGMAVVVGVAGVTWIIDHRRLDAND